MEPGGAGRKSGVIREDHPQIAMGAFLHRYSTKTCSQSDPGGFFNWGEGGLWGYPGVAGYAPFRRVSQARDCGQQPLGQESAGRRTPSRVTAGSGLHSSWQPVVMATVCAVWSPGSDLTWPNSPGHSGGGRRQWGEGELESVDEGALPLWREQLACGPDVTLS